MSIVSAVRSAAARPALLVWCGLLGLVDAATLLGLLVLTAGGSFWTFLGLLTVQRVVLIVVLGTTRPGSLALARDEPAASVRAGLADAVSAVREEGGRSLRAAGVTRAVAIPATLGVFLVFIGLFLGVDTAAVWAEATVGVGVDRALLALVGVSLCLAAATWLVDAAVAYQDLLTLDGEVAPRGAWRASVAATTDRPLAVLSGAFTRGLLLTAPWVVALGTLLGMDAVFAPGRGDVGLPGLAVGAAVFLAVAAVARATVVAYHCERYAEWIRPSVAEGAGRIVSRPRRVAVAALLILAAVGGVGLVRTAEIAPGPDVPSASLEGGPDAAVETALERTAARDVAFEYVDERYNRTTGQWQPIFDVEGAIDRDGHELRIDFALHLGPDDVRRQTFYAADGIFAVRTASGGVVRTYHPLETRLNTANWTAAVGRSFDAAVGQAQVLPTPSEGWTRVDSGNGTVTYARAELTALEGADVGMSAPDRETEGVTYLEDTGIRLVVDRETATVREFEAVAHYRRTEGNETTVVRQRTTLSITAVGDVGVDRPSDLPGPGPLERVWAAVYYG